MIKYVGLWLLLMLAISGQAQIACTPSIRGQQYFSNSSFQQTDIQAWALHDGTNFAGVGRTDRQEAYLFVQPKGKTLVRPQQRFNGILPLRIAGPNGSTSLAYLITGSSNAPQTKSKGCIYLVQRDSNEVQVEPFFAPTAVEEILLARAIPYLEQPSYWSLGRTGDAKFSLSMVQLNTNSTGAIQINWSDAYFPVHAQVKQVVGLHHAQGNYWWLSAWTQSGYAVFLLRDQNGKLEEVDQWFSNDRFISLNAATVDKRSGDLILAGLNNKIRFGNNWITRIPLINGRMAIQNVVNTHFGGEGRDYPLAIQYINPDRYAILLKSDAGEKYKLQSYLAFAGQDLKFDAEKCWAQGLDAMTTDQAALIEIPSEQTKLFIGVNTAEARPRSYAIPIPSLPSSTLLLSPPSPVQWSAQVSLVGASTMNASTGIPPAVAPCNFKLRTARSVDDQKVEIEFPEPLSAGHQLKIWQNTYASSPDLHTISKATRSLSIARNAQVKRLYLMDVQAPGQFCYEIPLEPIPVYQSTSSSASSSRGQVAGIYPQIRTRQGGVTCKDTVQLRPPGLDTLLVYDVGAQFGSAATFNARYQVRWFQDGQFFRADTVAKKCSPPPSTPKPRLFVLCIGMQYQDSKWQQVFSTNNAAQVSDLYRIYSQISKDAPDATPYESIHVELINGPETRGKESLIQQFKRIKESWKSNNPSINPLMRTDTDHLLVFLSGHGTLDEKNTDPRRRYVICTDYYDADYPETFYYGLDFYQRILADFSCAKTTFLLETCASGQLLKDIVGMGKSEAKDKQMAQAMVQQFEAAAMLEKPGQNQREIFLLSSAAQDSASFADPVKQRGYFTWYLLESMLQCQEQDFQSVNPTYLLKKIGEKVENNNRQAEKRKLPSPVGIVGSSFPLLQLNHPAQIKKLHEEAQKKHLCE